MINIRYKKQLYKYILAETVTYQMNHVVRGFGGLVGNDFVTLTPDGILTIRAGYAWDGASGPTIDTKNTMAASLVHDAGYQLMRDEFIPLINKDAFDRELELIMLLKGAMPIRASYYYSAVRRYGHGAMMTPHAVLEA